VAALIEPAPDADAQTSFERTRADLVYMFDEEGLPTNLETTVGTVCGLPAWTVTYAGTDMRVGTSLRVAQARPVTMLLVVIKTRGDTYLVGLVQTVESDNPMYQRDAETILTGFQVLPPAPAQT
jgi:hypothetical protein